MLSDLEEQFEQPPQEPEGQFEQPPQVPEGQFEPPAQLQPVQLPPEQQPLWVRLLRMDHMKRASMPPSVKNVIMMEKMEFI